MGFKFNPLTGNLDVINTSGGTVPSIDSNYYVDIFTLDATQAANKEVTLSTTPSNANKVTLDLIGGTSQFKGTDFDVVGDKVTWNGLSLEAVLAVGDRIRIIYII